MRLWITMMALFPALAIAWHVLGGTAWAQTEVAGEGKPDVLFLALVTTAGLFLHLQSEFLAAVQILLYAGGVVTIVVFAIMLTERLVGTKVSQMNRGVIPGLLVSVLSFLAIYFFLLRTPLPQERPPLQGDQVVGLARELLGRHVLAFELLAILFVASLLGALFFARKED